MTSLPQMPSTGKPLNAMQKELIKLLAEVAVNDFLRENADSQAVENLAVTR